MPNEKIVGWAVFEVLEYEGGGPYSRDIDVHLDCLSTKEKAEIKAQEIRDSKITTIIKFQPIYPVRKSLDYQGIARRAVKKE